MTLEAEDSLADLDRQNAAEKNKMKKL